MLGVGERLEHLDRSQLPEQLLVRPAPSGEVPEGAAGVGDDGEGGGAELDQEQGQATLLTQNTPVHRGYSSLLYIQYIINTVLLYIDYKVRFCIVYIKY